MYVPLTLLNNVSFYNCKSFFFIFQTLISSFGLKQSSKGKTITEKQTILDRMTKRIIFQS